MIRQLEIAEAFLIEANNDYDVVSILIEKGKYNLAVYHAQQAVEKMLKACLAAEGKIGQSQDILIGAKALCGSHPINIHLIMPKLTKCECRRFLRYYCNS